MCLKEAGDMDYDIGRKFIEMASMRLPGIGFILFFFTFAFSFSLRIHIF